MDEGPEIPPAEPSQLTLDGGLRAELVAWARGAMPNEACGLLVGHLDDRGPDGGGPDGGGPGGWRQGGWRQGGRRVARVTLSRNLAGRDAKERFVLDPAHWVAVEKEATSRGLHILGVWHSHPSGRASHAGAAPSELDMDGAVQGWSYLILSIDALEGAQWRSWRQGAGAGAMMVEERLLSSL